MPSCSSSSNIQASLTALSTIQGGSRLTVAIPSAGLSGFTSGSVIRYDVPSSGYTLSIANDAARSEVFGVVEGLDLSGNNYNVVIYGSINLSNSSQLFDVGSAGGCGGNDIYFLSGTTAGGLQNLAPTNLDYIVKPIYQVSPHIPYTGVVVNYLGYRIGGDVEAVSDDNKGIGEIKVYVGNAQFEPGFLDASIHHTLSVADYPEFYSQVGTVYGYIEEIVVSETFASIPNETLVYQSETTIGRVTYSDAATKTIRIRKNPGQAQITTGNQNLRINSTTFTPLSTEVYATQTPKVQLGSPFTISAIQSDATSTTTNISQLTKVAIKVKPTGLNVTIPSTISTPTLSATSIKYGTGAIDLESKLNNFESRIYDLEY